MVRKGWAHTPGTAPSIPDCMVSPEELTSGTRLRRSLRVSHGEGGISGRERTACKSPGLRGYVVLESSVSGVEEEEGARDETGDLSRVMRII